MENRQKETEILNDLIEINNDRADGFEKASKDIKQENIDLKFIFNKLSSESRDNVSKLKLLIGRNGDDSESGNTVLGTLHRAWIDIKASLGGDDRHSILAECERGEDAIKKAYREALQENELEVETRNVLLSQQLKVNAGHDAIKALRDAQDAID